MLKLGLYFAGSLFSAVTLLQMPTCSGSLTATEPRDVAETRAAPLGLEGTFEATFTEEFNGTTLDTARWTSCYWWEENGCTNLGNNELQWYRRDNVSVADGSLVLTAREESVTGIDGRRFAYTSGIVTSGRYYKESASRTRFEANGGVFEMRAKVPAGKGYWPAFWMLPSSLESKPEIDIMEVLGHRPRQLELHFHYRDENDRVSRVGTDVMTSDLSDGWHVYGLEWAPDRIVWYLDGREVWRYTDARHIPDEPMYLLINLAVGGDWPGDPDRDTVFPGRMEVDYVRAWRRTSQ